MKRTTSPDDQSGLNHKYFSEMIEANRKTSPTGSKLSNGFKSGSKISQGGRTGSKRSRDFASGSLSGLGNREPLYRSSDNFLGPQTTTNRNTASPFDDFQNTQEISRSGSGPRMLSTNRSRSRYNYAPKTDDLDDIKGNIRKIFEFYVSYGERMNLKFMRSNKFMKLMQVSLVSFQSKFSFGLKILTKKPFSKKIGCWNSS